MQAFRFRLLVLSCKLVAVWLMGSLTTLGPAGYWSVTFSGGSYRVNSMPPAPYNWNASVGGYGGGGAGASVTCTGAISVRFEWTTSSGEPVPLEVFVVEKCAANGSGAGMTYPIVSSSNGFGDPSVVTSSANGAYLSKTSISSGTRISQVHTGGCASFILSVTPSASSSNGGGSAGASVWYSAAATNKTVFIRFDGDTTYREGPDGTPLPNNMEMLWETLSPRVGDVGCKMTTLPGNVEYYEDILPYTASKIGPWTDPFHQWLATGALNASVQDEFWIERDWARFHYHHLKSDVAQLGVNGPKILPVKLTVTDPGNYVSVAHYNMRFHNALDNWKCLDTSYSDWLEVPITIRPPGYGTIGQAALISYSYDPIKWNVWHGFVGDTIAAFGPILAADPIHAGLLAALGLAISSFNPIIVNEGAAVFTEAWGATAPR
jgi:hypothetical protein